MSTKKTCLLLLKEQTYNYFLLVTFTQIIISPFIDTNDLLLVVCYWIAGQN